MKNFLLAAVAITAFLSLASCAKQSDDYIAPVDRYAGEVTVSFIAEPNSSETRAFFDNSGTETWEKNLKSVTVMTFNDAGALLVQRSFTAAEVTAKKATFSIPRSAAGTTCEFYVIANKRISGITTKAALLALLDNAPATYNGPFATVSTTAPSTGFVMSGATTKTIAAAGSTTDVAISLKRTVAKVAVQTSLAADFNSKYDGSVKITSATVSKAASQTPLIAPATPASGTMNYTTTQNSAEASEKFNNLFYLFETSPLNAGNRVLITLNGLYDKDGDFTTTGDQAPVTYEVELNGAANNGKILRNGYYRVAVTLSGLTGQSVSATITVADWETPVTQNISLGQ